MTLIRRRMVPRNVRSSGHRRTKRRAWPIIRERRNPGGTRSFMVDAGMVNGTRPRKFFQTRLEAETYAEQLRVAKKNEGEAAFNLSQKLRVQAMDAERQLAAVGATLPEAVTYFLRHAAPRGGKKLLSDVISELLRSKEKTGKRDSYVSTLRFVLNAFGRRFDGREIGTISREELELWLDNFKNLTTRKNRIRDASILFAFALKRGYCGSNPLAEIERPTITHTRPEIYTIEEVTALLGAARRYPDTGMLPLLTIGLFSGLRTSELLKLQWQDVSLEHGVIDVSEKIAKTRQQRNVEINDTLRKWLELFHGAAGAVAPSDYREKREAIIRLAEISKWKKNGLRHSFGSYHVARFGNAAYTAMQMGHNTTDMLFKHYRNYRIRKSDADAYWNLKPSTSQ